MYASSTPILDALAASSAFSADTGFAVLAICCFMVIFGVSELAWRIPRLNERAAQDRAEREAMLRWSAHLLREQAKWGR